MNISKLNKCFENSKLTKKQFAEQCGVTRVTIDNALKGADIRVSILESIAKVLKVSVGELFDESEATVKASGHNAAASYNGNISINERPQQEEVEHLRSIIDEKERLLQEKERTIQVQQQLIDALRKP